MCTPVVRDNYRRGYACVRADSIWEIFMLSVQFCFECEACLKNKLYVFLKVVKHIAQLCSQTTMIQGSKQ